MTIKPRALRKGDLVGLAAPSGPIESPALLGRAVAMLRSHGFEVRAGPCCSASYGYLAGDDRSRAAELNVFFADPAIAGIVCLRGGYGTSRILDALDYGLIARNPKLLVGYSDITAIHLALLERCSLASVHGPMGFSDVLIEGEGSSTRSWLAALESTSPLGFIEPPPGRPAPRRLVGGLARGEVVGGNLSLVAATMGTPYEIDVRGRILFLEDVDERPYRVDRMLTQLRLAGKLDECAGILLGDWRDCGPEEGKPSLSLEQVFMDVVAPAGKPCVVDFPAGHCNPTLTLPLGVEAVLDADAARLEYVEAAAT